MAQRDTQIYTERVQRKGREHKFQDLAADYA